MVQLPAANGCPVELPWLAVANHLWTFANSPFVLGVVVALAASFAGAYGAQWIVEREGNKRRALEEIRATNAAITLALFISNVGLSLKRQHLDAMVRKYADDQTRREAHAAARRPEPFEVAVDWQTLPMTELPFDSLRGLIFDRVDCPGPVVSLVAMLEATAYHLRGAVNNRNSFIEEIKNMGALTGEQRAALYFGLPKNDGTTDRRYPNLMDAISNYTDAMILFATILAVELVAHGDAAAARLGKAAPKIRRMKLRPVFAEGLIPEVAEYEATLRGIGVDVATVFAKYR